MSLADEARAVHAEKLVVTREEEDRRRAEEIVSRREEFIYGFGEEPNLVAYEEGLRRIVVEKDDLRFVREADGASMYWKLLVTCPDCGEEYVDSSPIAPTKDSYRTNRSVEERRAHALERLGSVLAKEGRDKYKHFCRRSALRSVLSEARLAAKVLRISVDEVLSAARDADG